MRAGDVVSLRVRTADGPRDVVGVLVAAGPTSLSLRRRDGSVETVAVDDVEAGRVVPPGPATTVSVAELQRVMASGWRALESEPLGDWLLRAAGGFTRRANSALVVGSPGMPLAEAVDAVSRWYGGRGLPPRLQVPASEGEELAPVLAGCGWSVATRTHVMTAEAAHVLRAGAPADVVVRMDDQPDEEWLAAYRSDAHPLPAAARDLLVNHPSARFASIRADDGTCHAIARVAVDGVWAGLFGVEVAPEARRRRLATRITAEGLRWAVAHGARRTYVQVLADNAAGVALWRRLGYDVHHDYVYATAPAQA